MPPAPDPSPARLRRRRRLRVSLRGLMALILAIGVGLAWHLGQLRTQGSAVATIRKAGGGVAYDFQFSRDPAVMRRIARNTQPPGPTWLRRWLGDDWFRTAVHVELLRPSTPEVLAAVGRLHGLVQLRVGDTTGLAGAWGPVGRLRRLEEVWLVGPGVDDSALAAVAASPGLEVIRLGKVAATDGGIAELAQLGRLRDLSLNDCPHLTDAGVGRMLAASRSPRLASLSWSRFADSLPATIRALADRHRTLRRLTLNFGPVEDADLAPIGALGNLTDLGLIGTRVTDAGMVHLEPLAVLEGLTIEPAASTDRGLKSVGKLRGLTTLGLEGSPASAFGLAEIADLPRLKVLRLGDSNATDSGVDALARPPALERLILVRTRVTGAGLAALQGVAPLRELAVGGAAVTRAGLAEFREARPEVEVSTEVPPPGR